MCRSKWRKVKCMLLAALLLVSCFASVPMGTVQAANDGFTTAEAVEVNTGVNGCLWNSSDVKYYTFTISTPGVVSLDFMHKELEASYTLWKIYLCNADREEMLYETSQGSVENTRTCNIGLPAGTYYVRVMPYSWNSRECYGVDYQLCVNYTASNVWETEFNDGYLSADGIFMNTVVNGCITESEDYDYYTFTTVSDGVVSLDFMHKELEASYTLWEIYLYNADRECIMDVTSRGSVENTRTCNIGLPAGTYYVMVAPYSWNSWSCCDYQLCVNYTASDAWETEFNGGFTIADTMAMNQTKYGSLKNDNDIDYYRFSVTKAGYVNLNFMHAITNEGNWEITLYNQSRQKLTSFINTYAIGQEACAAGYLPQGDYYIVVEKPSYRTLSTIDYSIQATYTVPQAYINKVKAPGKKKLTVTWWKQTKGVSGTQVVIGTNKKCSKNRKTVTLSSKKTKYTFKKLKKKKTYYVKIRHYINVDGVKYYGPYSKAKKVKIK